MKIPKKLKIGGHIYPIKVEDRVAKGGIDKCGTSNVYSKMGIWIDSTIGKSQQESTLIHEIIEILNSNNNIELTETQICVLEAGLYQVLKDNKLLKE